MTLRLTSVILAAAVMACASAPPANPSTEPGATTDRAARDHFKSEVSAAARSARDTCAPDADITGKPNVRFTVTPDGRVTQVHLVEAH